jgi:flagellar biosynthesis chaperone FliJ
MNEFKARVEEILDELRTERDELRVRLHLAKLESSEEWQKLEHQLAKLESKARELGTATADASEDMGAAAKLLAEEIRDGFKKIVRHF